MWLGLSHAGRAVFTATLLAGGAGIVFGRAQGDREGGAPLVVLALLVAGVVALMPSAAEPSLRFAVSSCGVGSGVIPERWPRAGHRSAARVALLRRGAEAACAHHRRQ